jgi:hypothetical protein
MPTIDDLFYIKTGKIPAFEYLEPGNVPCVYNYNNNNGIIGHVKVENLQAIFKAPAITVGYFGDAFVQFLDFTTSVIDKSKVKVLIPKEKMTVDQLLFVASYINTIKKVLWNYARYCGIRRLKQLEIPDIPNNIVRNIDVIDLLPVHTPQKKETLPHIEYVEINKFFKPVKGRGKYLEKLGVGTTPIISATNENNGITAFVDIEPIFKAPRITVERVSGSAFVQLYDFVTVPDDIIVLEPLIDNYEIEFLFYVASLIYLNRWKYCYGRKLSKTRLNKMKLPFPSKGDSKVDMNYIKNIVDSSYGWNIINNNLNQ